MVFRSVLSLLLTFELCAAPGPDLNALVSAQKGRRDTCEATLRDLARTCPQGSPKWKEARVLYRKAQERTNTFLDSLVLDIRNNAMRKDYQSQIQEAEAAAAQAQIYLDTALCDGTTTQGRVVLALPILLKVVSAISTLVDGYKATRAIKEHQEAARKGLIRNLEAMRWRPIEEFMPGSGASPAGAGGGKSVNGFQEAAQDPARFFCLETGFHTGPIRRAALDPSGRFLATVSEDKTLRLFDPATLTPIRVLRPPMGPEESGKLYALALSPDGNLAAVSGFTRDGEGASHRIYLLDTRDGHLVQTLSGLPQVVNALSIAPDGQTLVVHLGGRHGLRLYRLPDGTELARDPAFMAPTYGGAFAPDGRYAATCDDGYLRLYGPGLKQIAKMKAPGASPFGVAFNPDGSRLAVGYADGCRVDLLNGRNLLPLSAPSVEGVAGPLSSVAWSRDGRWLYASGGVDFGPALNPVCRWEQGGQGERRDLPLARATVSDLVPLPDGSLVAACQDPLLVKLGPAFQPVQRRESLPGNLRQVRRTLQLDATGAQVSLDWRLGTPGAGVFSVAALGLQSAPSQGMAAPIQESAALRVENWEDQEHPSLHSKPLEGLQPHEVARSLSLAPGGAGFALGTDWFLRLYDAQGRPGASVSLPAACWGVNHSGDGRLIVAALADGTLRWFQAATGQLLMSLYVHPEDARWILWHPEGYYAAGVGGEDLAGWRVQREGEAGDFFPMAHFRSQADQPRLFPLLLQGRDLQDLTRTLHLDRAPGPDPALRRLDLPPVLHIQEPLDGAEVQAGTAEFRVSVTTWKPGDPVQSFRVLVDGQKLGALRDIPPRLVSRGVDGAESHFTLKIPVPDKDCRISLAAETTQGVSEPVEVYLKVPKGILKENLDPGHLVSYLTKAPTLNILAVGVGTYEDPALRLKFPAKDARDIAELFRKQANGLYSSVKVTLLTDAQATRERVLAALREVRDHSDPHHVTLIFISGHGLTNAAASSYCFLPFDARMDPEANLIDSREIRDAINGAEGKTLLFLDTCHAGNVMGAGRLRGLDDLIRLTRLINELSSAENGVTVFSSSTGRQLSLESSEWENGAFTRALKEGLGGKADPAGKGKVTVEMLDRYLRDRVKELTQGLQTPVSGKPAGAADFPLVVLQAGGGSAL